MAKLFSAEEGAQRRAGHHWTDPSLVFETLAARYPKTVAAFAAMPEGAKSLSAVADLERRWVALYTEKQDWARAIHAVNSATDLPSCSREHTFDVMIAGGGLGLLAGAALAARGLRVMVFDRERVGVAHREWNISERELSALVRWGIFTASEIDKTVPARYRRGLISFDSTGTGVDSCPLYLTGVLDVALDAQKVLDLARNRFVEAGGTIREGRTFRRLHIAQNGQVGSVFEVDGDGGVEYYRSTLAIDMMGSVSPLATALNGGLPFDGVCPTAGTVLAGLEHDPTTGDVLVSVAPAQDGRQLIWEGFPGRDGETTAYLFYYDTTGAREALDQSLLDLFERYFTLLPTYRPLSKHASHLRPMFGYIPARHGSPGRTAARGLLCLGDSAAGQSPLTFCGFGSFVRHIGRITSLIDFALEHDLLEEKHLAAIGPHQANLRVAWVFSRFMQANPGQAATAVNRMMNIFCRALQEGGEATTLRFLQDRYGFADYIQIMLKTARHEPRVFILTARILGWRGLLKWAGDMAWFAADSALRTMHGAMGRRAWFALEAFTGRFFTALSLRLRAARTRWQATS